MMDRNDLKSQVMAGLTQALQQGQVLREGVEDNVQALLQAQLAKLDVVTREEFDTQKAMLSKAQMQLAALQAQVDELLKTERS